MIMNDKNFKLTFTAIICITLITIFGMCLLHVQKLEENKLKYEHGDRIMAVIGKITGKTYSNNKYTLEIGGYGKFLVPKEVWDKAQINGLMPIEVYEQVVALQSVGG